MMVFGCVSSKSSTCELIPFIRAACMMSRRSLRPRTVACAGPEKGESAAIALSTVSCLDPPSAAPIQFNTVRAASFRTGPGKSAAFAETTYFARRRVASVAAAGAGAGVALARGTTPVTVKAAEVRKKRRRSI
jgi:hypothetical protein